MKIVWNKVTRFSQIAALVLFVFVFALGIFLGRKVGVNAALGPVVADAWFTCDAGKSIHAVFYKHAAHVALSGGPEEFMPQTVSGSGARYANDDESLVFWTKGDTAFVTEGNPNIQTYSGCTTSNN